jgi:hypothetical protein
MFFSSQRAILPTHKEVAMFELHPAERFNMAFKPGVMEVTIDGVTITRKDVGDATYFCKGHICMQVTEVGLGANECAIYDLLKFR